MTVAELVLAIGLLGLAIVFVLALFTRLISSSTKSSSQTVGLLLAQRRLDQAMREGPPSWGANLSTVPDLPLYEDTQSIANSVYQHDDQNKVDYWQHFRAERVQRKSMGSLWKLTADVVWWPADGSAATVKDVNTTHSDQGRLSVTLERVYYFQDVQP